jgi:hypothetical protein
VLIDWPVRWRGCLPEYVEQFKADAAKNPSNHYFGETGEIVAVDPRADDSKTLAIVLDSTSEIVHLYDGAVTVTERPKSADAEILALLQQIVDNTGRKLQA